MQASRQAILEKPSSNNLDNKLKVLVEQFCLIDSENP